MYNVMIYIDPRDPETVWLNRTEILRILGVTIYEYMTRAFLGAGMNVSVIPSMARWPWRGGPHGV